MTPPLARSHPLVVIGASFGASFGGVGAGWPSAWCSPANRMTAPPDWRPSSSAAVDVDHCVLLPAIAPLLSRLAAPPSRDAPPETLREHCGGALSEVRSGRPAWPS